MESDKYLSARAKITLEKIRFSLRLVLSEEAIEDAVDVDWDEVARCYVLKIKACVLGEQIDHKEIKYPADWWQAFKAHWFPDWAKMRWPVRYTVHSLDLKVLYPRLSLPDDGRARLIEVVSLD